MFPFFIFFGEGMSRPPWFLCWLSCIIADYIVFRGRGIGKSVFAAYLGVVSRSLILISYFLRLSLLSPQSRRMLRAIRMLGCFHSILFSVWSMHIRWMNVDWVHSLGKLSLIMSVNPVFHFPSVFLSGHSSIHLPIYLLIYLSIHVHAHIPL